MALVDRVLARYVEARNQKPKTPAINKEKDRVVYVLPETLKEDSPTYEALPEDKTDHIEHKGKPRRPAQPRKPKKPHKPDIPRATTPAPVRPPHKAMPALPVPPVPPVKHIKPVKHPTPTDTPRKWKVTKPKPLQAAARVADRYASVVPFAYDVDENPA